MDDSEKQQLIDEAPQEVITRTWRPYGVDKDDYIHLRYYTFCVLLQLRDALRRRSVFVAGKEAILNHLRQTGFEVREEDKERLSLVSDHINFVGQYPFSLPEAARRGELRPFYDPNDPANLI